MTSPGATAASSVGRLALAPTDSQTRVSPLASGRYVSRNSPQMLESKSRAAPCCFLEVLVLLSLRSSFLACVPSAGTRDGLSRARKNSAESSLRRVIGWRTLDALSASPAFERGFPVPPCVVRCCVLLEGVTTLLAANQKGPNT